MSKIISYGCSFTAGTELLDHRIHHASEMIKHTRGMAHWRQHYRQPQVDALISQEEKLCAWPAIVARELGWSLHNRAQGGNSMAHMLWQIERDLDQFDAETLVLVGVTEHERSVYWRDHSTVEPWILADIPNWPHCHWHPGTVVDVLSETYQLWHYLGYLLRLVDISRARGSSILMFDMTGLEQHLGMFYDDQHGFWQRYREIRASGVAFFDRSLCGMAQQGECLAGSHPCQAVHQRFADWVLAEIELDQ